MPQHQSGAAQRPTERASAPDARSIPAPDMRRRGDLRHTPPVALVLQPCGLARARDAAERWHYLGTVPAVTVANFEVIERDRFIGAVVFGSGPRFLSHGFGCLPRDACEMVRVALDRHDAPVSRIVSIAIRLLIRARPHIRLVVSYADAGVGHHGGIYQAGGWTYTGGQAQRAFG